MGIDIYWTALVVLLAAVVVISWRDWKELTTRAFRYVVPKREPCEQDQTINKRSREEEDASKFQYAFLQVYLLAIGSEWLQGADMYALLRDDKGLDESTVARLFVTAYIAAAISALVTGFLADRFGRRLACLAFCLLHSLSSLSILSNNLVLLFASRALAGVALTLLWTVFESWMVTEFRARELEQNPTISLSRMMGTMTKASCFTAILGGLVGHCMVWALRSRIDPYIAAVTIEAIAVVLMLRTWNENYGHDTAEVVSKSSQLGGKYLKVWILSFVTCCFEGTSFLVLFYWPGILQNVHAAAGDENESDIPYRVIFAAFMAAMILGAMLFNAAVESRPSERNHFKLSGDQVLVFGDNILLSIAMLLAGVMLLVAVFVSSEIGALLAFLVFEVCNGFYVPSVTLQRGKIVGESNRAWLYGLMKLPLFIFVIVALSTAVPIIDDRRYVFAACFVVLIAAAFASVIGLGEEMDLKPVLGEDPDAELDAQENEWKVGQKALIDGDASLEV